MPLRIFFRVVLVGLVVLGAAPSRAQTAGTPWHLSGDLSEACTCSVPCSCNFGAGPSRSYCWALFSLDIHTGNYGSVKLDGLRLAGANGAKGMVVYIDDRADKAQAAALRSIALAVGTKALKANGIKSPKDAPPEFRLRGFKTAHIEQTAGEKGNRLKIGNVGEFEADYITGIDGKTPVVVENNWSWNIQHGMKAKTRRLRYRDAFGNNYDMKDTNSNQGTFDWSDTTPIYFR